MSNKNGKYYINGKNELADNKFEESKEWKRLHTTESILTLSLLIISISVVIGKLYVDYGNTLQWENLSPSYNLSRMNTVFNMDSMPQLPKFEPRQLVNTSSVISTIFSLSVKYGWLIKATICSIIIMSFTWYITYKDSNVPGVNPSFPCNPFKRRISDKPTIHINYFVGILNGALIFVYMCL